MAKILSLIIASLLVLATIGMVSAASTFSVSPTTITFDRFDTSKSFTMSNSNTSNPLNVNIGALPVINGVSMTSSGYTNGDNFNSSTVTLNLGTIDWNTFDLGRTYSDTFTIVDNATENQTMTVEILNDEFCEYTNTGDLSVKIDDIDNLGMGDDDAWYPLDEIEVTVELRNRGAEDIEDAEIEWGLYDPDNAEWIIEITDEDDPDVDEDDEEKVTFTINLEDDIEGDLEDLDEGDYVLYVRATGEVDDDNDTITCGSDSDSIDVKIESDYVVLDDIKLTGTTMCGSVVQLTADVYNIGDDNQDDVTVEIYSYTFDVNEVIDMGDIDAFEKKSFSFEFQIPEGIEEQNYKIDLRVYDEDNDLFENSDDDETEFQYTISVSGNCIVAPNANVLASLEEGGKAGQELKIRATVSNTGSVQETFTLEAADYSEWAELVSIEPAEVIVPKDSTKDVVLTFNVNSDADDKETFNLIVTDTRGASSTQPIAVTVEQGFGLRGSLGDNAYLWGIALANLVLIVIIIVVAVKAMKR